MNIYFGILLLLAALVMGGLALATCLKVLRLRNKRMSWRAGTLKGFPLFSSIFLTVSVVLAVAIWINGSGWERAAGLFYLVIGGGWFVASYFSSKCYMTDHGIVKNVSDPAQTVAWHQIHDFFERKNRDGWHYTFIYREANEETLKKVIRLRLTVPPGKHEDFKRLISHKLGRHISCYEGEMIDVSQFN